MNLNLISIHVIICFFLGFFLLTDSAFAGENDASSGWQALASKDFELACQIYQTDIKDNPGEPVFYNNLGCAFARLNNFKDAEIHFYIAKFLDQENSDYIYNYGVIHLNQEKYDEAIEFLLDMDDPGEEGDTEYHLGACYFYKNDYEISIRMLEQAAEKGFAGYDLDVMLCENYLRRAEGDDLQTSKKILEKLEKEFKGLEELAVLRAKIYEHEKKHKDALKTLRQFIRKTDSSIESASAYLAEVYDQLGQTARAVDTLGDAIVLTDNPGSYILTQAWLYYKSKRYGESSGKIKEYMDTYGYNDKAVFLEILNKMNRKLSSGERSFIEPFADPGWWRKPRITKIHYRVLDDVRTQSQKSD